MDSNPSASTAQLAGISLPGPAGTVTGPTRTSSTARLPKYWCCCRYSSVWPCLVNGQIAISFDPASLPDHLGTKILTPDPALNPVEGSEAGNSGADLTTLPSISEVVLTVDSVPGNSIANQRTPPPISGFNLTEAPRRLTPFFWPLPTKLRLTIPTLPQIPTPTTLYPLPCPAHPASSATRSSGTPSPRRSRSSACTAKPQAPALHLPRRELRPDHDTRWARSVALPALRRRLGVLPM